MRTLTEIQRRYSVGFAQAREIQEIEQQRDELLADRQRVRGVLDSCELRECIITCHGMATGNYVQGPAVMLDRIGRKLGRAIATDSIMTAVLGATCNIDGIGVACPNANKELSAKTGANEQGGDE